MVPVACTAKSVTYKYLKPSELANKEITFEIK